MVESIWAHVGVSSIDARWLVAEGKPIKSQSGPILNQDWLGNEDKSGFGALVDGQGCGITGRRPKSSEAPERKSHSDEELFLFGKDAGVNPILWNGVAEPGKFLEGVAVEVAATRLNSH
jgi:hypothetical protein